MIKSKFTYNAQAFNAGRFEKKFNRVVQGIGAQVARDIEPTLAQEFVEPGAVRYPIEWESDKQRRAFFATDGFGRGIPTRRTGKSNAGWKVAFTAERDSGGTFQLSNSVSYTKYVRGTFRNTRQQKMHRNTGWEQSTTVRNRVFDRARRLIALRFDESLGSFGSLAL